MRLLRTVQMSSSSSSSNPGFLSEDIDCALDLYGSIVVWYRLSDAQLYAVASVHATQVVPARNPTGHTTRTLGTGC
jgi:hypothetical protein